MFYLQDTEMRLYRCLQAYKKIQWLEVFDVLGKTIHWRQFQQ